MEWKTEPISLLDSSRSSQVLEELLLIGPLPLILNLLVQAQETAESEFREISRASLSSP